MQDRPMARYIRQGFRDCGQVPLDFEVVMRQCYKFITNEVMRELEDASELDLVYFREHGHITDEKLLQSHQALIEPTDAKPRDQRPLSNQRAILINHQEIIAEYLTRQNHGEDIGDALLIETDPNKRRDLKAALKIVESKKKSQEKKDRERKRKELMTPQQLADEKDAKRQATEARKKTKAEKEQAALVVQRYTS
jgi:hypothetical protein